MNHPTLLHIDDNDDDLFLFRKACTEGNAAFNLRSVPDGKEGVEYLQGAGVYAERSQYPLPHLVLLDLKMPPPDGFAVLRWIRDHPEFNRLAVCIHTSSFQYEDIQKAYAMGANCFLTKTPSFEKLLAVVGAITQALSRFPPQLEVLKQLPEHRLSPESSADVARCNRKVRALPKSNAAEHSRLSTTREVNSVSATRPDFVYFP